MCNVIILLLLLVWNAAFHYYHSILLLLFCWVCSVYFFCLFFVFDVVFIMVVYHQILIFFVRSHYLPNRLYFLPSFSQSIYSYGLLPFPVNLSTVFFFLQFLSPFGIARYSLYRLSPLFSSLCITLSPLSLIIFYYRSIYLSTPLSLSYANLSLFTLRHAKITIILSLKVRSNVKGMERGILISLFGRLNTTGRIVPWIYGQTPSLLGWLLVYFRFQAQWGI